MAFTQFVLLIRPTHAMIPWKDEISFRLYPFVK